jgi:hypothetical protein
MSRLPIKHFVTVWGKECEVTVHQAFKTVWKAAGRYEDDYIETKGGSESSALRSWEEAAKYRGKDGPPPPITSKTK